MRPHCVMWPLTARAPERIESIFALPAASLFGEGVSRVSKQDHILVGLDIGTTKICAIVAEVPEEEPR